MLKAKFPLFALRKYDEITEEDGLRLIHTHYNTYILDSLNIEGEYARRRLALGSDDSLPYKLYPLRQSYSTLAQMVRSKHKDFIDSNGKVFKYRPSKFYTIKYTKVLSYSTTWNGKYLLMTKLPVPFCVEEGVPAYIAYVQVGAAFYLYDLCDEARKEHRRKI